MIPHEDHEHNALDLLFEELGIVDEKVRQVVESSKTSEKFLEKMTRKYPTELTILLDWWLPKEYHEELTIE